MSNEPAFSIKLAMCRHSATFASAGYSPVGLSITKSRAALVIESPVANKVTSIPSFTRASASTEATCSQGP